MRVYFERAAVWLLSFGKDMQQHAAIIDDEARAVQVATNCHGTMEQLYRKVELPDEPVRDDT